MVGTTPLISYYDHLNGDLNFIYKSGVNWIGEHVDTEGMVGNYLSMQLDKNNNPQISYYDATNGDLKVAARIGDVWVKGPVDTTGDVGKFTSLRLDDSGNPYISYYDASNGDLKLAYYGWNLPPPATPTPTPSPSPPPPGWTVETVTPIYCGEYVTSIQLDSGGHPMIAYYPLDSYASPVVMDLDSEDHPHLFTPYEGNYYQWTPGGWISDTIPQVFSQGGGMALGGADDPHISFREMFYYSQRYAHLTPSGWVSEMVYSQSHVGYFSSLALGPGEVPYISFSSNEGLRCAYKTGGGWSVDQVTTGALDGWSNAIAVDNSGKVHIAFSGYSGGPLKYALKTGSTWTIQTVDAGSDVGSIAIALDPAGNPHISYRDANAGLKHAYWTGSAWNIDQIDSEGSWTSIVVDASGYVHISYYQSLRIKYAHNNP